MLRPVVSRAGENGDFKAGASGNVEILQGALEKDRGDIKEDRAWHLAVTVFAAKQGLEDLRFLYVIKAGRLFFGIVSWDWRYQKRG
jgi:hypothetical protein